MADNFTPGETVAIAAGTISASASFALAQSANSPDCMISNAGSVVAFLGFGNTANLPGVNMTNATPILPNETLILRKGLGVVQCSAITASGTATLYFTAGEGN